MSERRWVRGTDWLRAKEIEYGLDRNQWMTDAEVLAEMGTLDLFLELERRGIAHVDEQGHGMDRMLSHRVKSTDPWGMNWGQPVARVWKTKWVQPLPLNE